MEFASQKHPLPTVKSGVLPRQDLKQMVLSREIFCGDEWEDGQLQPNSLDLRLGDSVTRLGCSFLPGRAGIQQRIEQFGYYTQSFGNDGILLERGQIYLFRLQEELRLPEHLAGFANPKSTTGRLDIFARLIPESGLAYDKVPLGYRGALYLEVVPRSFPVLVRPGDRLAQLRLFVGSPAVSDAESADLLNSRAFLFDRTGKPLQADAISFDDGLLLSPQLTSLLDSKIGYRAKRNSPPIDLRKSYSASDYWEPINARPDGVFVLEPEQFYIFASKERLALPLEYCAEMVPFDATAGEVRTHYAGFFDSGFGYGPPTKDGTSVAGAAAVLEVRSRDVYFALTEEQPLFRLKLLRNLKGTDQSYGVATGASYQHQGLRLAKQFV